MRISTRHVLSDISIHALRVEGDWCAQWNDVCEYISIHALRVDFTFDSRLVYSFIQHVATKVTVGQRGMYQKNMTFREIKV